MLTISFLTVITSCDDIDSETEYGFPLIYMPQSTIFSGGANNHYPVPSGNEVNPNYVINGGEINITLGVYRAGLQSLQAFNVDVYSDVDAVADLIASGTISNANVLPIDTYSFPPSVSVSNGSRENTFNLTIDGDKIRNDYPSLVGTTLLVAIGIQNPSNYELNEELAVTMVVIDSNAIL